MNAMLVGADRLGNIPDVLDEFGIRIAAHVTGRDRSHQRRAADLPVGVEFVCCRRSVCALKQVLDRREQSRCRQCAGCPR